MTTLKLKNNLLSGLAATLDLNDGTNYEVANKSWYPAIGQRGVNTLARSTYPPVSDTLTLLVKGATLAVATANLTALQGHIDKVQRSRILGRPLYSLDYRPVTTTTTNTARLLSAQMTLLETYADPPMYKVQITMERDALWMVIGPATFDPRTVPTPMKILVDGLAGPVSAGVLLWTATDPNKSIGVDMLTIPLSSLTATAFTTVASANSYNGNVLRYTPTGTAIAYSGSTLVNSGVGFSVYNTLPLYGVVGVRNNGAASFLIRHEVQVGEAWVYGNWQIVDTSVSTPRAVNLGPVIVPGSAGTFRQARIAVMATSATGSIDFDVLKLLPVVNECAGVVAFDAIATGATTQLNIQHGEAFGNDAPYPGHQFLATASGATYPVSYRGAINVYGEYTLSGYVFTPSGTNWNTNKTGPSFTRSLGTASLTPQ